MSGQAERLHKKHPRAPGFRHARAPIACSYFSGFLVRRRLIWRVGHVWFFRLARLLVGLVGLAGSVRLALYPQIITVVVAGDSRPISLFLILILARRPI